MTAPDSVDPVLVCFSYEYRSEAEAKVFEQIMWRYAQRGIRAINLFDPELHASYEAGFNLARWEALDRYIKANDLYDRRIIMQDITDVFVADVELDFHPTDVYVNRKKNCQHHAMRTLIRNLKNSNSRRLNLSRRIDIDLGELDAAGLKRLFVDPRYRSIYRFSNDVIWGYGRAFVELHDKIRKHIDEVPDPIRYGNCDETLYTHFHLHLPEARLNLQFGETQCHNFNYITQVLLGAASSRDFVKRRKIFTYQHSDSVPRLIDEMLEERPRSRWHRWRSRPAYVLDRLIGGVLSAITVVLQAIKRVWIAISYLRFGAGEGAAAAR